MRIINLLWGHPGGSNPRPWQVWRGDYLQACFRTRAAARAFVKGGGYAAPNI
jgi:hypothetical protein